MSTSPLKDTPENLSTDTQVYGSALTLQKYAAIREQMAGLAQKPIVIVNREELVVFKNDKTRPVWVLDKIKDAGTLVDWQKSGQRLKDFFQQSVDPEVAHNLMSQYSKNPAQIKNEEYEELAKGIILSPGPFAEHDFRKGDKDVGLIRAPDHSATVQDHISNLTGIPAHFIRNFPGVAGDYEAVIMLHEAKHIAQPLRPGVEVLPFEADADYASITSYMDAIRKGRPFNEDVPKFIEGAREASSVGGIGTELHALIKDFPSTYLGDPGIGEQLKRTSLPTHSTHAFFGEDGFDPMKFSAMRRVGMVVNMMVGQLEISAKFDEIRKELAQPGGKVSQENMRFFENHSSGNIFQAHDLGAIKIGQDRSRGYDMIKALHESKFFKPESEEAKYVERINNFLGKYAPDYISEPARVAARQELVPHLAQIKDTANIPGVEESLSKEPPEYPQPVPTFDIGFKR